MNLCSVSWEVIHMTSRAIRGLVPNLSGDNQCISSSHLPPPFCLLPPPWETTHQKHGHLSVWSWTRSQPNCTYPFCVHVCVFTCRCTNHKDKGRREAAQLSLVPEEASIRTGSDPGGRMWSCGARTHPGWIQGSTSVFTELEEWLDSLGIL